MSKIAIDDLDKYEGEVSFEKTKKKNNNPSKKKDKRDKKHREVVTKE